MYPFSPFLKKSTYFFFYSIVILSFLSLGLDYDTQVSLRYFIGLALLLLFFLSPDWRKDLLRTSYPLPLIFFACYLLFLLVRFYYAVYLAPLIPSQWNGLADFGVYHQMDPDMFFVFGIACVAFVLMPRQSSVARLAQIAGWVCFFIAVNALPRLLAHSAYFYHAEGTGQTFFHPLFHFHPWIADYLLARRSQVNFIGDIMSFGFFVSLGLSFYLLFSLRTPSRVMKQNKSKNFLIGLQCLAMAAVVLLAIMLPLSRGTILCFFGSVIFILLFCLIRFNRASYRLIIFLFVIAFGFLTVWTGTWNRVTKEMDTLEQEFTPKSVSSLKVSFEGWKRAGRIYQDYWLWGGGVEGYRILARRYPSPEVYEYDASRDEYALVRVFAMNHFLQRLAEDGLGGIFYILIYLTLFWEFAKNLFVMNSRFRLIMLLSFMGPLCLVLVHSQFNYVLDKLTNLTLFFVFAGTALALCRSDFRHE